LNFKLNIAIPAFNESEYLPHTIDCIRKQQFESEFEIFICVNQPDDWWTTDTIIKTQDTRQENRIRICEDNLKTIEYLDTIKDIPIKIIDKSSKGKGWGRSEGSVGWARKVLMDTINANANEEDVIISLDADTVFGKHYFTSIKKSFANHPDAKGICIPYYHELSGNTDIDMAILRYEIYMRYYIINLIRIGSPYSFTALGSAIAFPVSSYRAIRGIAPKQSGEDFYLLQKLCKLGKILIWNDEPVYPSPRLSDRVLFGTGPAMIKGISGDWSAYPIFDYKLFDKIKDTYTLFPELFEKNIHTPMSHFLKQQFNNDDIWSGLRNNYKNPKSFIRACHSKVDALRIFQFLKSQHDKSNHSDEASMIDFLNTFYKEEINKLYLDLRNLSFSNSDISDLSNFRNFLFDKETNLRKKKLYNLK
jgi:glycosyltransferase involved in cell wall biosynthesis